MHDELRVLFDLYSACLEHGNARTVGVTGRSALWRGEDHLDGDTALCSIHQCLFRTAILHLFFFKNERGLRTIDEIGEHSARVVRADDKVGIRDLHGGTIPVSIEDSNGILYILWGSVNDAILAILAIERRVGK